MQLALDQAWMSILDTELLPGSVLPNKTMRVWGHISVSSSYASLVIWVLFFGILIILPMRTVIHESIASCEG